MKNNKNEAFFDLINERMENSNFKTFISEGRPTFDNNITFTRNCVLKEDTE